MKKIIFSTLLLYGFFLSAQETEYKFTPVIVLDETPILSQGNTGTCWSFSTTSFIESEVKRINGELIDLSEMYNVRLTYPLKAYNYVNRQGKAQFGEGGLAHDVLNSIKKFGIVPHEEYLGLTPEKSDKHDHSKLADELTTVVELVVKYPERFNKPEWINEFNGILDTYLGEVPSKFTYKGKEYTPQSFAAYLKINPDDYVTLTSFTHEPYYSGFILNIPDNFSNGSYYNLPLDEYVQAIKTALEKGYTLSFSSDVSEKTFSKKYGIAINPSEGKPEDYFKTILPEKWASPEERQALFENYSTTDDHLMHITGLLKDQLGNQYFKVKNSWGTNNLGNNGYIYMSVPYFRLKSISVTVHKDALDKEIRKKLGI